MELFIKLNNTEETKFLVANYPNAFMLLTIIALRTNRKTGKAQIGVSDFTKNGMTEKCYRTAKSTLEKFGYCKFTGTKKGTIAEISDKIYNLNMGEDTGEERANTEANNWANTEKTEKQEQTIQYNDFENEKGEDMGEDKNENGRSEGRLTKNILKNKEYSNNINIITSETESKKDVNSLIPLFKDYNVLYEDLFKNKTERKVLQELIDKYEYETTENMIKWALEHQDKYTAITKPTELKRNINKIILKNKKPITNQSNYIDYDTINN